MAPTAKCLERRQLPRPDSSTQYAAVDYFVGAAWPLQQPQHSCADAGQFELLGVRQPPALQRPELCRGLLWTCRLLVAASSGRQDAQPEPAIGGSCSVGLPLHGTVTAPLQPCVGLGRAFLRDNLRWWAGSGSREKHDLGGTSWLRPFLLLLRGCCTGGYSARATAKA